MRPPITTGPSGAFNSVLSAIGALAAIGRAKSV
jgi:hypothetical protein